MLKVRESEMDACDEHGCNASASGCTMRDAKTGFVCDNSTIIVNPNDAEDVIFKSPYLEKIFLQIQNIAKVCTTTLITGATGTGKEIIAKLIHLNSPRNKETFIAVNCGAIPDNLFESEMFGIERGVATGVDKRAGYFERADKGTLFLDEIGEMSLDQQVKLLRTLDTRSVTRLGGQRSIKADIRLVAATNKNLLAEVEKGTFRDDLYYRINVIHIDLPPLCRRKQDIVLLAQHFLDSHRHKMDLSPLRIGNKAMAHLQTYLWPGNCRELNNEMERVAVLAQSAVVGESDLSLHISDPDKGLKSSSQLDMIETDLNVPLNLEAAEKLIITKSLKKTKNNKSEAAKLLGISREGLRKKLIRLGLTG